MDVLNIISWLKSKRQVTTVDASQTLIPLGLRDPRRDDGYLPGAISVDDLLALSPGLPDFIEYDTVEKTVWNNGGGDQFTNTSFGQGALIANTNGNSNVAIGKDTLANNLNGYGNVAVGLNALVSNINGTQNVAIGLDTLVSNTFGERNIAIGVGTLFHNTVGIDNVAIGQAALINNTTGEYNISIGRNSLQANTTGSSNTSLGAETNNGNFSSSIILGRGATATANNQFVVGSSTYNAGTIATEALTPTVSWRVKINGVDYKIPLQIA